MSPLIYVLSFLRSVHCSVVPRSVLQYIEGKPADGTETHYMQQWRIELFKGGFFGGRLQHVYTDIQHM